MINLRTGEAVGLHFSGLFLESNFAVPASRRELLRKVQRAEAPGMGPIQVLPVPSTSGAAVAAVAPASVSAPGTYSFQFHIPVEISVKIGGIVMGTAGMPGLADRPAQRPSATQRRWASRVGRIRSRFSTAGTRGSARRHPGSCGLSLQAWVDHRRACDRRRGTQEADAHRTSRVGHRRRAAAVSGYRRRRAHSRAPGSTGAPRVDLAALEAPPRPGGYREPPDLSLDRVQEHMRAVFHISPDSGFPNLRDFLGRVHGRLTATMYEWDAEHISHAIEQAIKPAGRTLKMVTQRAGTSEAVEDMKHRLGSPAKFEHVWASVGAG